MDANYKAMIWGVARLSGLVSEERPSYGFGYSDEHDAELEKLLFGIPFPLIRRMNSPLSHGHLESFNGLEMTFNYIDNM